MVAPAKLGIAFVKSFFGHVQMCQGHSNVFFFVVFNIFLMLLTCGKLILLFC